MRSLPKRRSRVHRRLTHPQAGVCRERDGLLFFGSWKLFSSFVASVVETNRVLIVIIILIAIDAKGAQALRAAGQPVVAGLVLFFKKNAVSA